MTSWLSVDGEGWPPPHPGVSRVGGFPPRTPRAPQGSPRRPQVPEKIEKVSPTPPALFSQIHSHTGDLET
jgi:hypothetical protein